MDAEKDATFSVTGFEVGVIPGTEYSFIRIAFLEKPRQRGPSTRRYVFSYGQLAELRDTIEQALKTLKESLKRDPPPPVVH